MHQDSAPKPEVQPPVAAQDLDKEDGEVIVWSTGAGPDAKGATDAPHRKMPQKGSTPSPLIATGQSPDRTNWRYTKASQIDDGAPHWEIADEMRKLQINDNAKDVAAANATGPAAANSVNPRNSVSPVATPTSSSSSSPPANKSTRLSRHSRDPSYSDTSSSDSSVVTPLHVKNVSGVSTADSDVITDAEYRHLQNMHNAKQDMGAATFPTIVSNAYPPPHPRPPHLAVVPGYDYRQGARTQAQQGDGTPDFNARAYPAAANGNMSAPTDHRPAQYNGRQEPYRAQRGGTVSASYVMSPPHVAMSSAASVLTSPQSVPAAAFYPGMAAHPGHPLAANMYEMMVPGQHDINGARQAQYRPAHQHSVSDPASLRDATTLALIGNSLHVMQQQHQAQPQHTPTMMPGYPGVFTPGSAPLYPNQFYGASMVSDIDVASALARMPQYNVGIPGYPAAQPLDPQATGGPSANNRKLGLYKTELCRSWEEKGSCRYGPKCQFAHGEDEIRKVARHPKYKTEICRTFWVSGSCPYGKRCCFIHTELPASGAPGAPGSGASPEEQRAYQNNLNANANNSAGRTRSLSTGSDPNEPQSSLLARISAKRNENAENASPNGAPGNYARNNNNSTLRVDTNVMDHGKGNNYPYTSNPALPAAGVRVLSDLAAGGVSPAPASAAPDFGRQRMEAAAAFNQRLANNNAPTPQGHVRHQYNNSESGPQQRSGVSSPFSADGPRVSPPNGHGHMRSDSGNGHQWAQSNGPRTAWAPEIAVAGGRYNDRPWA